MLHDPSSTRVLVTGAGGFIATRCILRLLEKGYRVRGTLRDMERAAQLRNIVTEQGLSGEGLEFCRADLLEDEGWQEAVDGCDFVLHVASPMPMRRPKHEDELIAPAREGTLRLLRAAGRARVRRVVLTSSIVAVCWGHDEPGKVFTEADWAMVERPIGAYAKAKTLAERAAWEFTSGPENTGQLELVAVNPGYVFGPLVSRSLPATGEMIRAVIGKHATGVGNILMPVVDVRDVADAHLAAMVVPEAAGQRFCCTAGTLSQGEIASMLQRRFAGRGYRIRARVWPNAMVHLTWRFTPGTWHHVPILGKKFGVSSERLRTMLGWQPRTPEEAIFSLAESMVRFELI